MSCEPGAGSEVAGPLPEGTYRNILTAEDVQSGCQPGEPGADDLLEWGTVDHVQELVIHGSNVSQTTYAVGHPEELETGWSGTYRTFRDTIELIESGIDVPLTATWTFDGTNLVLSDMRTDSCDHPTVWTTHPWELVVPEASDAIEGDYVMTASWQDAAPAGCPLSGPEAEADESVYELELHDGQIKMYVRIGGPDAPREDAFFGPYELFRDRVELGTEPTLSAAFEVTDDELRFSDMTGGECGDVTIWTTYPWVRVEPSDAEALVGSWSTTFDGAVELREHPRDLHHDLPGGRDACSSSTLRVRSGSSGTTASSGAAWRSSVTPTRCPPASRSTATSSPSRT